MNKHIRSIELLVLLFFAIIIPNNPIIILGLCNVFIVIEVLNEFIEIINKKIIPEV